MRSCFVLAAASSLLLLTSLAVGIESVPDGVYVDPDKAPMDLKIQGEYTGKAGPDEEPFGVQVIALGNDRYRLVALRGGLPGDGADEEADRLEVEGTWDEEKSEAIFQDDEFEGGFTVRIDKEGKLQAAGADGEDWGTLERVERKSPTLGAEPPEGAVVLFDGSSAEKFRNGRVVLGDLLLAETESLQKFGDHTMHLEFRTPFMPHARGQARANSGVYIQNRYELQVLDSFGLTGENNECGGFYQLAAPRVNMCFPPLQWQTYDIDFTAARWDDQGNKTSNARVTVRHNGVLIHEDLELPRHTPGRASEAPGPGPVYLQGHGNLVVYRNIWAVER